MQESPLYTRTYDLLLWLIPQAQNFPRKHRFGLAERVQWLALDFQDSLVAAGKSEGVARRDCLSRADVELEQLRVWVRLARDLQCLGVRQYEHAARLIGEVGRLLGAWLKNFRNRRRRLRYLGAGRRAWRCVVARGTTIVGTRVSPNATTTTRTIGTTTSVFGWLPSTV